MQLIHGDVKPQNLLLSADKTLMKLADFGLASVKGKKPNHTACGGYTPMEVGNSTCCISSHWEK